ncbi:carotenoid phi-ring synthase-like [Antedon mediterranea]|uniref:carotenoid phi-ring synthase-like n=1 Tax=Antedon mediterranea TaxID=105859 RepID=UPI003AF8D117
MEGHLHSTVATSISIIYGCLLFVGCCIAFPKPPVDIPPVNPSDAPKLPAGVSRTVLIAGGGLASLSAALELSERGFNVTICEKDLVLGGRLHTKNIERLNQTWPVEHAFHAWFYNYHQFKDIRKRLGIDGNFREWKAVDYVFRNYLPEEIYSEGPFPLNLLGIIFRSPNLKMTNAIESSLSLPDLLYYNYDTIFEKYANISLDDWAKEKHVDEAFYSIIMRPALSVTLNERHTISAAEMLTYMQMYFLSEPQADGREVTTKNYQDAVIGPWKKVLQENGVRIETNSTVKSLYFNSSNGKVISTETKEMFDHVILATNLVGLQRIINTTQKNYSPDSKIGVSLQCLQSKVGKLPLAPRYKIFRAWFDKQPHNRPDILETPDYTPVNLIAQYHLLEEHFAMWANKTNGSVLEFHLYTWKEKDTPDDKVWEIIQPTVKMIYPEIFSENFTMLAYHVNSFEDNFPSFKINTEQFRPNVTFPNRCGIPNLSFAGDWLHTSYPSSLMERSVSTGRQAANHILLMEHVRQVPLLVTNSHGPGLL